MKNKIIKLLDDWKVNKHKQELMAEELLNLCGVVKSFYCQTKRCDKSKNKQCDQCGLVELNNMQ